MNNKIFLYGFLLSILFLSSCKTTKSISSTSTPEVESAMAFISTVENNTLEFKTLSARLNINLNFGDNDLSSRAELRIVKDSALQISIQPFLGIEMFRMELTPDSLKMIDRMNKRYVADNYSNLKGQTPIEFNFYNLQALFTNQLFVPGEKKISRRQAHKFKFNKNETGAVINIRDAMDLVYTFIANANGNIITTNINDSDDKYNMAWDYKDFRTNNGKVFPMKMDIGLSENGASKGKISMDFSRMQLDTPLKLEMSIPSKYKQITLQQILKSLSNIKM